MTASLRAALWDSVTSGVQTPIPWKSSVAFCHPKEEYEALLNRHILVEGTYITFNYRYSTADQSEVKVVAVRHTGEILIGWSYTDSLNEILEAIYRLPPSAPVESHPLESILSDFMTR